MATRSRPLSFQQLQRAARSDRDTGQPFLAAANAKPRENFTETSPAKLTCAHG
jgi:hypothetical protein